MSPTPSLDSRIADVGRRRARDGFERIDPIAAHGTRRPRVRHLQRVERTFTRSALVGAVGPGGHADTLWRRSAIRYGDDTRRTARASTGMPVRPWNKFARPCVDRLASLPGA